MVVGTGVGACGSVPATWRVWAICRYDVAVAEQQILSEAWIDMATTPTAIRPTYGFMNWFLNTDRLLPCSIIIIMVEPGHPPGWHQTLTW